jgi:hypothetical protein
VASDEIGYNIAGKAYCGIFDFYSFHIIPQNSQNGIYRNLVTLYTKWKPRLLKKEMTENMERLQKEIQKINDAPFKVLGG